MNRLPRAARSTEAEVLDDPAVDAGLRQRTLRHLWLVNRTIIGSRRILLRWVIGDALRHGRGRSLSYLDVGAGDGRLAEWLLRRAAAAGVDLSVTALDVDRRAVALLEMRARRYGQRLRVVHGDARDLALLGRRFTYVGANLVLHHFRSGAVGTVIAELAASAERRVIAVDPLRRLLPFLSFAGLSWPFLRGSVAYADGLVSIRRGFRSRELQAWAELAGLEVITAGYLFPGSVYLIASPTGAPPLSDVGRLVPSGRRGGLADD